MERKGREGNGGGRVREGRPIFSVQFVGNPSRRGSRTQQQIARLCGVIFAREISLV